MRRPRPATALAAALLTVVVLGGCSDDDPSGAGPSETATSEADEPATYVALGDSFTAAPGVPVTDAAGGCQRSSANYPALVAEELGLVLDDVSCSGADTLALVGAQQTQEGAVPPQFAALVPGLELVTMGMGGNDEGLYRDLVETCGTVASQDPAGAPCREAMNETGTDRALERIAVIQTRLTSAITGIKDRAPEAQVVLVGYPQLVPQEGECDTVVLARGDYAYVHEITDALGAATQAAAEDAGALYVDMLAASDGHDICAGEDAWVNGIANDLGRPAAPLHPFAEEQQAAADLVVEAVQAAGVV